MVLSAEDGLLAAVSSSLSHVIAAFPRHWSLDDPVSDTERMTSLPSKDDNNFISRVLNRTNLIDHLVNNPVIDHDVPVCFSYCIAF